MKRKVGIWMYTNSGGEAIQEKIEAQLREREIEVTRGLDLRFAHADRNGIICNGTNMCELDLFFSYNAGQQTQAQLYFYETLSRSVPTLNSYAAFALTEDKFRTNMVLAAAGIPTTEFFLCHRENPELMREKFNEWGKMVFKPLDGWGGVGMVLLENKATIDTIMPFLNQTDIRQLYVEKFVDNDFTDYRVDIVDGAFIGCYGRKASDHDWRTNVTSGGSVILREPNDAVVNLAIEAARVTGLEIAGVDILYDREREEYIVLEVNGIPAFATPNQEAMGLNFNAKKIEKIVELIDRTTK